jgi:hypothetical protein
MDTSSTPTARLYATSKASLLGESLVRIAMDFHGSALGSRRAANQSSVRNVFQVSERPGGAARGAGRP